MLAYFIVYKKNIIFRNKMQPKVNFFPFDLLAYYSEPIIFKVMYIIK